MVQSCATHQLLSPEPWAAMATNSAVGRPIVFVDVEVGGRNLPHLARSHVDHRQTLLVDVLAR